MKTYLPIILGMGAATYIPKLIPMILLTEKDPHPKLKQFLTYIPYTSLGILVIRGIITTEVEMRPATIVGITIAGIVAYFKGNLVLSVMAGIIGAFITLQLI